MNPYDPRTAQRVWQRVQSAQMPPEASDDRANLRELILNEWLSAATCSQLARALGPREGQILRRLAREEHIHGACLRGMYALKTGDKCPVPTPQPLQEPPGVTLRRCYGQQMRTLKAYESRSSDPEYGQVFARMALQEQEHCMALLQILGMLEKQDRSPGK